MRAVLHPRRNPHITKYLIFCVIPIIARHEEIKHNSKYNFPLWKLLQNKYLRTECIYAGLVIYTSSDLDIQLRHCPQCISIYLGVYIGISFYILCIFSQCTYRLCMVVHYSSMCAWLPGLMLEMYFKILDHNMLWWLYYSQCTAYSRYDLLWIHRDNW